MGITTAILCIIIWVIILVLVYKYIIDKPTEGFISKSDRFPVSPYVRERQAADGPVLIEPVVKTPWSNEIMLKPTDDSLTQSIRKAENPILYTAEQLLTPEYSIYTSNNTFYGDVLYEGTMIDGNGMLAMQGLYPNYQTKYPTYPSGDPTTVGVYKNIDRS
jgi:hypothetical protein